MDAIKNSPKSDSDISSVFELVVITGDSPPSRDSVAVQGVFVEGAHWESNKLEEMNQPQQYSKLPTVLLKPIYASKAAPLNGHFNCPLYRTTAKGDSNFVVSIKLPSDSNERHW